MPLYRLANTGASEVFAVFGGKIPRTPLERIEIDTAHFNIGIINADGHYIGKVTIYLVLDVFSRAIIGFAVQAGNSGESSAGVIHALMHAIFPKDDPKYPMHGLFQTLIRDSGPGYRSNTTKQFLDKICHTVEVAKTRTGWGKPFIERFIRTLRTNLFTTLDGYLGKYDPKKYSDDTLQKSASLTIEEFYSHFYNYIVLDYHHTPHQGLKGKTPFQMWNDGLQQGFIPILPSDIDDLKKLRPDAYQRTLTYKDGISYLYQRFHSIELSEIAGKLEGNKKVTILVDPLDASAITVVNPFTGELLNVINTDKHVNGRSFSDINAYRKDMNLQVAGPIIGSGLKNVKTRKKKNKSGKPVPLDSDMGFDADKILSSQYTVEPPPIYPSTSLKNESNFTDLDEGDEYEIF